MSAVACKAKLLRALQEGEVERVGGTRLIKVDVRVVAASNVDLRERMRAGLFRDDLFFRVNVFPINLLRCASGQDDIRFVHGAFPSCSIPRKASAADYGLHAPGRRGAS